VSMAASGKLSRFLDQRLIAAKGASSVKGGNRLIFEEFVKRSPKADVHLDTQVKRLTKISHGGQTRWEVQYTEGGFTTAEIFDAVILAAPFAQTGIEIVGSTAADLIPPIDYVNLHVTIVLTNASAPQACFFNAAWPCEKSAPALVFTALDAYDQGKTATEPIINSLSYLRAFRDGSFAVKIFSRTTLSTEDLATAFGHVSGL
jgi:prenylcysteine oxidase/farnesylcysteine lyase